MEITDVRIKLVNNTSDRLKAFCSITLDDEFVIRDIKLVEGSSGLFVAMPSRKLAHSCPECRHKNPMRAHFCNECGADLPTLELPVDDQGRLRLYRDIAHPITPEFREKLQGLIVEAFDGEHERAGDPDYEPSSGVDLDDEVDDSAKNRRDEAAEDDSAETHREEASEDEAAESQSDEVSEDDSVETHSDEALEDDSVETHGDEALDDDSVEIQSDGVSEYNALIAGLNSGSPTRDSSPQGRREDRPRTGRTQDSSGRSHPGDRSERKTGTDDARGGQRKRSRGGRRRKPQDDRRTQVSEPRTAPAAEVVPEKGNAIEKPIFDKPEPRRDERAVATAKKEDRQTPDRRQDRDRDRNRDRDENRDQVSLAGTVDAVPSAETLEDSTPFGAGIL